MSLAPGTRLGSYEVVSSLGAGGMGEVYRARDTKLGREVALKVVADSFADDPERLARFQREAQLLAALNHPHIATIHGLEESNGAQFLVMELIEGETLATRLKSGPLPVPEALAIARQVADALQAAHEKGIIHRDLKPANIALTPDGRVKVLDFGLAKALEAGAGTDMTASPTLSLAATQAGVILGTAAYMAPEQARGKPADKRADIWAFGCVLYEMLAGKPAFDGDDVALVLASVLKGEPDWAALPTDVSKPIVLLLGRCLEKDRRARVPDIGAALFVLDEAAQLVERVIERVEAPVAPLMPARFPLWRRVILPAAALVVGALVAGGAVWWLTSPTPASVVRTTIATSGMTALTVQGTGRDIAITPDGSRFVYRGNNQLLVRALDQLEPDVLGGLGQPRGPFISPDGQWIGFFDGATVMKKVAITGGPPVTITKVDGAGPRGATWGPDGTIVYATAAGDTGLQRVSAAGGEPAVLTKPERERGEADHLWPEFLPSGGAVLFTISQAGGGTEGMQVAVFDLRSGTSKVLIRGGSHAHYVPSGHLVYGVAGTLRAVSFNLGRLEVVGTPVPVLEGVVTMDTGAAQVAVAANGSLVYVPGKAGSTGSQQNIIVSVDRQGRASQLPGLRVDSYRDVRVSPDGSRLALATATDVWTYDFARATLSRLTTDSAADTRPLWTPDGQRIVFSSARAGYPEIFWRPADGTGSDQRLLTRAKELIDLRANSWSSDGKQLLFGEVFPNLKCAIGQFAIERPSDVKVLVTSEFCNDHPTVSPDGRWMAYQSNVSGRYEIYVERNPELGSRQQISTAGGQRPIWSRNGRELFFSDLGYRQILTVPVQSGATLVAGRPQVLFDAAAVGTGIGGARPYDVAPDGRFLIIRSGASEESSGAPANLVLVQHWTEELKRLVPVN
jgi:protein kinase-like protein/WD40 repeat protein